MLRSICVVTCLAVLLVACGGGGGGTPSAPSGLNYTVGTGEVGSPYGPYPPAVTGTVTGYSVNPALPVGLTLDPTSGVISGTPVSGAAATTYTVTARNGAGSTTATLNFAVLVPPPSGLAYPTPVIATVGATLAPVVPKLNGHADAFSVSPPLPTGLTLDPVTGVVSGTPTSARLAFPYIVTASSVDGSSAATALQLTVDPPPAGTAVAGVFRSDTVIGLGYSSGAHMGLTDASGGFTYEQGSAIAFNVGAVSVGAIPLAKNLVTPMDLVANGTGTSIHVLNVERFLMMLDQDGNPNNGIQISAAVTAAAANWSPVDFDTADLTATLGSIIQQASAADGVPHVLPDVSATQTHLRASFYCMHSGNYHGFGTNSTPGSGRVLTMSVFPDGGMHSIATGGGIPYGFDIQTSDAVSPLLDGTFAQNTASPSVSVQGQFVDGTYLSGTYVADVGGTFQAVADASVAATYKFTGTYTETFTDPTVGGPYSAPILLGMNNSNQISGLTLGAFYGGLAVSALAGTVSGNTFTGTASYSYPGNGLPRTFQAPVSGTYTNTAAGITFDGQFTSITGQEVIAFSTVGCRAN